ncbi:MAG TPA: prepilin-type N-terminal cleavage/methylation domain-containing protein [Candidatus Paceibacterota bacterium]|jgi:prepilin-type N-terminal cleavage/methylation domain-containing protein
MRGFTMIELLLYIALFSVLVTGIATAFRAVTDSAARVETDARLTDELEFVVQKVEYVVSQAQTIEEPGPNGHGRRLSARTPEGVFSIYVTEDHIVLEDSHGVLLVSDGDITTEVLSFERRGADLHLEIRLSTRTRSGQPVVREVKRLLVLTAS